RCVPRMTNTGDSVTAVIVGTRVERWRDRTNAPLFGKIARRGAATVARGYVGGRPRAFQAQRYALIGLQGGIHRGSFAPEHRRLARGLRDYRRLRRSRAAAEAATRPRAAPEPLIGDHHPRSHDAAITAPTKAAETNATARQHAMISSLESSRARKSHS